jgi:hypothetical protein
MTDDERLHLDVRLELGADPICGTVQDATGAAVEFSGWIGLMSAFDNACLRARGRADSDTGHGGRDLGCADNNRSNVVP